MEKKWLGNMLKIIKLSFKARNQNFLITEEKTVPVIIETKFICSKKEMHHWQNTPVFLKTNKFI